jgi:hypothetical protein
MLTEMTFTSDVGIFTIEDMEPGTRVEVRNRYRHGWARGFEVAEVLDERTSRFRVRRRSDGSVIPAVFDAREIRLETTTSIWGRSKGPAGHPTPKVA